MKLTHENKVERFYSHGSDRRGSQEGGFLSFGYWTNESNNYHQAAETLINRQFQFLSFIYRTSGWSRRQ